MVVCYMRWRVIPAVTFVSGPHEPMAWLEDENEDGKGKEEEDEEWEVLEG
jgi:hypothetical protein